MIVRFYLLDAVEVSRRKTERLIWDYIDQKEAHDHVIYEHVESDYGTFADELVVESGIRNVYVMPVKMGNDEDGLEVARKMRDKDKEGYIIFVTKYLEYAMMTYNLNLRALNYIYSNDPNLRENLYGSLEVICEEMKIVKDEVEDMGKSLIIKDQKTVQKIYMKQILYIETHPEKRGIRIHTSDRTYDSSESLKTIIDKLDESFVQSHRSYIVNMKKMTGIESEGQSYIGRFSQDKQCYISKKYYPMIRESFGKEDKA